MRIGILGGTFDPIHIGHLVLAEESLSRLELDQIWFIPTGEPWLKESLDITDPALLIQLILSDIYAINSEEILGCISY